MEKVDFSWKNFWKAFFDLVVIGFFTTLSTIIILISFLLKAPCNINYEMLYEKGDFFLYSIAFLSSSYIYYKQKKDNDFLKTLTLISMVLCSITYALIYSVGGKSNTIYMKDGSIFFIILSSIVFFITQYNIYKDIPDINKISRGVQKGLSDQIKFE